MTDTVSQFWPQLVAFAMAMGIALAINGMVHAIRKVSPKSPSIRRWLPALPGLLGGLLGPFTWPVILELTFTGYDALKLVNWKEMWLVSCLLGVAQGAISSNMYKFYTQTVLGEDGALKRALFKFLDIERGDERTGGSNDPF